MTFRIIAAALALAASSAAAIAHEATVKGVTVAHPWARATPAGAKVGAAYLEIKTDAATTDKLIGAEAADVAGRVEIHTHIKDGDVMKMRRVESIAIPAGKSHVLRPSGDHVMLMDLKKPLKEGDLIKLKLMFEKAGTVEVDATVEPIGAKGPHGMDAQPGHEMDHSKHGAPAEKKKPAEHKH